MNNTLPHESLDTIDEMVFMLQKEVVDRMTAGPGNKIYGRLSKSSDAFVPISNNPCYQ